MADSTFKVSLCARLAAYLLLLISVPLAFWRQSFKFDVAESICLILSLAYLHDSSNFTESFCGAGARKI